MVAILVDLLVGKAVTDGKGIRFTVITTVHAQSEWRNSTWD